MCYQDIITQHHKEFGYRLFTVHTSVFVPFTRRPALWQGPSGGQLSLVSLCFRTILHNKSVPIVSDPQESALWENRLRVNWESLFNQNKRFIGWGTQRPCCPVPKTQREQWLGLSSPARRGEETIMGEVISSHPRGKREKKKLNYLGMRNWTEAYRTQSRLEGNTG